MKTYTDPIISQYQSSPRMLAVLSDWNTDISPIADLKAFYYVIWNITTAVGYGLDVWGRIVGVSRSVPAVSTDTFFGFAEAGGGAAVGFRETGAAGSFYAGQPLTNGTVTLSDATYRQLILMKAFANSTNCSAYDLNTILLALFNGAAWAVDSLNMTFQARFNTTPTSTQLTLLTQTGVLARPAGVAFSVTHA